MESSLALIVQIQLQFLYFIYFLAYFFTWFMTALDHDVPFFLNDTVTPDNPPDGAPSTYLAILDQQTAPIKAKNHHRNLRLTLATKNKTAFNHYGHQHHKKLGVFPVLTL